MYQNYPDMVDSGIDWLGKIPSDWDVFRISNVFNQRNEKVSDKDFQPLSVTKKGVVLQLENAAKTNDGDNRKKVLSGDYVINSRSDRKGSSGLSKLDGSVSLINTVLRMNEKSVVSSFIHHLLRSCPFQEEFYRNGQGIVADLWSTNYQRMKNICVPIPQVHSQKKIADFLDTETAKIDNLIAKQERLLGLLEEKRRATITHAVTRGLDQNVELKETNIPWLRQIPLHWELKPIKLFTKINNGGDHKENEVDIDHGYPVFGSGGEFARSSKFIYDGKSVLFGRKGTIDKPLYLEGKFWTVDTMFWSKIDETIIVPKFLYFVALSIPYAYYQTKTALPSMTQSNILSHKIAVPEMNTQQQIIRYLEDREVEFIKLTQRIQTQVSLLKERRISLISHAVTGKIKV
jgi:type I restriction enzyme S subunit